jgi:hypothetical protein
MTNKADDREHPTRREFALGLAGAVATVPLAASLARGQTPAPAQPPPQTTLPPPPSPVAVALLEVAKARFGEYLTPEEHKRVFSSLEGSVATADRLRAVKLKNSDEPDLVFSA